MDDTFTLYDLKVEVIATDRPMVCSHKAGGLFSSTGGKSGVPEGYILFHVFLKCPFFRCFPAKQRPLDPNDWMLSDTEIACPDPELWSQI